MTNEASFGASREPKKYQIHSSGDSRHVHAMVDRVMNTLPTNRLFATLHAYRNLRSHELRDQNVFSLTDIPLARFHSDAEHPLIEPTIGSLIVRGSLAESRIGNFYTNDRIFRQEDGSVELRGANYFINKDSKKESPFEKLAVIERDFRDGLSVLEQVGRPINEKEFLMYLGVLDYLKIHSLSLLHTLTYDERNGQMPQDKEAYLQIRNEAVGLMRGTVRRFYQTACGFRFDTDVSLEAMGSKMDRLVSYL
ncbi:MAG TPA: hypothetical protein VE090_00260, partial [Methylomirabilota bacterium]|nr:hypothetical protein [Methylomirabilota bacterium]